MHFWILATIFVMFTKHMNMDFYLILYKSHVFKTLGSRLIFVYKTKDSLNEWNMILIYYVMDFFQIWKTAIILRVLLSIKIDFLELFFRN
jgi:hypothetical protein